MDQGKAGNLRQKSITIIQQNQNDKGAFIACPNFKNYRFCWLRDGSFIAYSMDRVGEYESAAKFFRWVHETISGFGDRVDGLIAKKRNGQVISALEFLPTRYTMEGGEAGDDWPNFQLDGYGTWLWALTQHIRITGATHWIQDFQDSIAITVKYLQNFWDTPNYDCWEEFGDKIHSSTLACIYGGLESINQFLNDPSVTETVGEITAYFRKNCIVDSRVTKFVGCSNVDASLLWVSLPFNLLRYDEPEMRNTVLDIERRLLHRGGVHRYPEDTYYGGGEWLLLSCWLGWYYHKVGRNDEAVKLLEWVISQADTNGEMAEQVTFHVNNPAAIEPWVSSSGAVAKPLLWSHAMYLVLLTELLGSGFQGKLR